ncbi:MAG: hypothetical protein COW08_08135 [Ignavibacteriales bacterium CG12_big_fil_rev_8_21_14_0_65_30_8]|nr:MAG: hypothetical protein COW08_08135 [Ignavibacteriales bacterium CG12_big_fil_rev_8_21_14_0_65_30_8]
MKKNLFIAIIIILSSSSLFSQTKTGTIKLGVFNPSATNAGFILGYETGWYIDHTFTSGLSIDWFNKNYIDQNLVSEFDNFFGPNSSLNQLRAKTNLHAIPIMGNITGSWPIAPKTRAYVTGAVGAEILLIFYRNYDNPDNNEFQAAVDFAWKIGAGVSYELGERSDGLIEIAYNNSEPSWQFDVKDATSGKSKVFERRFDLSGIMIRLGFKFYF